MEEGSKRDPRLYAGSLRDLFELLRNGKGNVGVVVDRESMLRLSKMFERLGWKIEYGRDEENPEIVNYVVIERPNGSIVLMFHPHGRIFMGVDPPYRDRIESIIVALGVRSYPSRTVPIPRVFTSLVGYLPRFSHEMITLTRTSENVGGACAVLDPKSPHILYIYD